MDAYLCLGFDSNDRFCMTSMGVQGLSSHTIDSELGKRRIVLGGQ